MARARKPSVGDRVIKGLADFAEALEAGEDLHQRFTVRTVRALPQPRAFTPRDIIQLRRQIGASQAKFAEVVGSSVVTVQSWEQGHRKPTPMARRLLEEIDRGRDYWQTQLASELVEAK